MAMWKFGASYDSAVVGDMALILSTNQIREFQISPTNQLSDSLGPPASLV